MKILAIIPAREGSKGVSKKNIYKLNNKPLIHYTLEQAIKIKEFTRILVSTESKLIKSCCDEIGDFVPFFRTYETSNDDSRTIDVVEEVITRLKNDYNEQYDYVCLLQPTSPLRNDSDIKNCINIMKIQKKGSVISLTLVDEPHPNKMKIIENGIIYPLIPNTNSSIPRQELPAVYELNGAIYLCETSCLLKNKTFFSQPSVPYVMPIERSVNINNYKDLNQAEYFLSKNRDN